MGLMKRTPRGFISHVGLNSRQDWDLRDYACAEKCPWKAEQSRGRALSISGPTLCTGKPLHFSEPRFPHRRMG